MFQSPSRISCWLAELKCFPFKLSCESYGQMKYYPVDELSGRRQDKVSPYWDAKIDGGFFGAVEALM